MTSLDSSGARVDCPPESVPEQILARALADPDAPAVINSGRTLTYGELIDRARDVAGTLIAAGIERNEAVGVCSQRGASSVTCLLGIWFAGAVYTPINPACPDTRIESIFDAAEPKIVLVDDAHSTRLDAFSVRTIRLADVPSNPEVELRMPAPDDSSYVVFTSGSTGKPKGVEQTHRTLMNLVAWQRNDLPLKSRQHVALFAAFGFDVSLQEMSYTLASGAELHVTPLEARSTRSRSGTSSRIIKSRSSSCRLLHWTPCATPRFADPKRGESLKAIVVAGEALKITQRIRRVFTMLGDCKLVNHYGPSETHVVTVHTLDGDPETWPYLPPIGHPVPNTDACSWARWQPLPIGSTGELYVGGDQVARGYLKRDDLTVERFGSVSVRSGDEEIDLGRLYRTGDLVRLNGDGDLEFRGAPTLRSRSAETVSSSARSRCGFQAETMWSRPSLSFGLRTMTSSLPATWCLPKAARLTRRKSQRLSTQSCPTTWCLRRLLLCRRSRSMRTGRSRQMNSPLHIASGSTAAVRMRLRDRRWRSS